jgi:hypothetical protein
VRVLRSLAFANTCTAVATVVDPKLLAGKEDEKKKALIEWQEKNKEMMAQCDAEVTAAAEKEFAGYSRTSDAAGADTRLIRTEFDQNIEG